MTLHKQTLSLNLQTNQRLPPPTPHLQEIVRKSIDQQIHHHVRSPLSAHQTLIQKTKRFLPHKEVAPKTAITKSRFGDCVSSQNPYRTVSYSHRNRESLTRGRRQGRVNETKKQLQLLNELYRQNSRSKARYQEQLQLQQAKIHETIAQHDLRRTWYSSNQKSTKPKFTPTSHPPRTAQPRTPMENQIDFLFQRLSPYRRLIQRRKSKIQVQPWQVTNDP